MTRYYSLYEKQGRRWIRLTSMGFPKQVAIRVFQDTLLSQRWLRPDKTLTTGELRLRPTPEVTYGRNDN